MKKLLKNILLISGFVLGSSLVGTGLYLENQKISYNLYKPLKLVGLIMIAGISGIALKPLSDDITKYKIDKHTNGK